MGQSQKSMSDHSLWTPKKKQEVAVLVFSLSVWSFYKFHYKTLMCRNKAGDRQMSNMIFFFKLQNITLLGSNQPRLIRIQRCYFLIGWYVAVCCCFFYCLMGSVIIWLGCLASPEHNVCVTLWKSETDTCELWCSNVWPNVILLKWKRICAFFLSFWRKWNFPCSLGGITSVAER